MHGMRGFAYLLFSLILMQITGVQAYNYPGTIHENGDSYIDPNEMTFLEFDLFAHDQISLHLDSEGEIVVLLCDCSDIHDVAGIFRDMDNYGYSDRVFLWVDTQRKNQDTYVSSTKHITHAAIYSGSRNNPPSMWYELQSSISAGDRFSNQNAPIDYGRLLIIGLFIIVIIGAIRMKKQNASGYSSGNRSSTRYERQEAYYKSYRENLDREGSKFCSYCGVMRKGIYCDGCGTKL